MKGPVLIHRSPSLRKGKVGDPCTASLDEVYHRARTHLALQKDAPDVRPIERPEGGKVVQIPEVGGLHHRYVRRAA
jgi:hypothetical protein